MSRVGIVGLGLLGSALSRRLLAAGYEVLGYDIDPERTAALARAGGRPVESALEIAKQSQWILLSLLTSKISAAVMDEMQPALGPSSIVVDTSTGSPAEMEALAARGIAYLDATVAGSSRVVDDGRAIVMCGGDRAVFDACAPLFAAFAAESYYCGPSGAGARMKLVVNLVLGLNRAVLAEGLVFAEVLGIDPAAALEILKAGPAQSRAMDAKGAKMLAREYAPEARLAQHHKDVRLILDEARRAGLPLPLSALHDALLSDAEALGFAEADNSAIIELFRHRRNA